MVRRVLDHPRLVESHWDLEDEFVNLSFPKQQQQQQDQPNPTNRWPIGFLLVLAIFSWMVVSRYNSQYLARIWRRFVDALTVLLLLLPKRSKPKETGITSVANKRTSDSETKLEHSPKPKRQRQADEEITATTGKTKEAVSAVKSPQTTNEKKQNEDNTHTSRVPDPPTLAPDDVLAARTMKARKDETTLIPSTAMADASFQEDCKSFAKHVLLAKQSFQEHGIHDETIIQSFVMSRYNSERQMDFQRNENHKDRLIESHKFAIEMNCRQMEFQSSAHQHEEMIAAMKQDKDWLHKLSAERHNNIMALLSCFNSIVTCAGAKTLVLLYFREGLLGFLNCGHCDGTRRDEISAGAVSNVISIVSRYIFDVEVEWERWSCWTSCLCENLSYLIPFVLTWVVVGCRRQAGLVSFSIFLGKRILEEHSRVLSWLLVVFAGLFASNEFLYQRCRERGSPLLNKGMCEMQDWRWRCLAATAVVCLSLLHHVWNQGHP